MRTSIYCGTFAGLLLLASETALALDASELATLRETVREMCLHPDRVGDYLKAEGEVKAGADVLFKIIKGDLSGKIAYEKWRGISITADKYKTDPRECAIQVLPLLLPAFSSPRSENVTIQQSVGTGSPPIKDNSGTVIINVDRPKDIK